MESSLIFVLQIWTFCSCWMNNHTSRPNRSSALLVRGSVLCGEAWTTVVMLSLAGDLAVAWHLAGPAVQLRDYRPPRVSVMWSRLSPTHSCSPQTLANHRPTLTNNNERTSLKYFHNFIMKGCVPGRDFEYHKSLKKMWVFLQEYAKEEHVFLLTSLICCCSSTQAETKTN